MNQIPTIWQIEQVTQETHDTATLSMKSDHPFSFLPGQFNMLYAFGLGEIPISISSSPKDGHPLGHTIRAVGTVSQGILSLKPGDSLGVRGPFGSAWPVQEAEGKDVLIIAGGIGLAPLRPVLYHLQTAPQKYGRVILLYGTRTPADILYGHEIQEWRQHFKIEITVDCATDDWTGHTGVVTTLLSRVSFSPENTIAMCCGPEIMMRFAVRALQNQGVTDNQIYLSMERNMKCGMGHCGHCQYGPYFVCKEGPVFSYDRLKSFLGKAEV